MINYYFHMWLENKLDINLPPIPKDHVRLTHFTNIGMAILNGENFKHRVGLESMIHFQITKRS